MLWAALYGKVDLIDFGPITDDIECCVNVSERGYAFASYSGGRVAGLCSSLATFGRCAFTVAPREAEPSRVCLPA